MPNAFRDPLARLLAAAALVVSIVAVVDGGAGSSQARGGLPPISSTPKKGALLRLGANKKFPAKAIPTVSKATNATKLGGKSADDLALGCAPTTVDLGSYCLDASLFQVPNKDVGRNDFAYASHTCTSQGGWLPSVSELLGAADRVKLASTIDDNMTTAAIDTDATDGLKDQREMTSTLYTTAAGASAAGSEGVTPGSKGDPKQAEPDPQPLPADPEPDTTQYMTVYDDHDAGGLAGGEPLGKAERFRCAHAKAQGAATADEGS